jgi:hypothetical protein
MGISGWVGAAPRNGEVALQGRVAFQGPDVSDPTGHADLTRPG